MYIWEYFAHKLIIKKKTRINLKFKKLLKVSFYQLLRQNNDKSKNYPYN